MTYTAEIYQAQAHMQMIPQLRNLSSLSYLCVGCKFYISCFSNSSKVAEEWLTSLIFASMLASFIGVMVTTNVLWSSPAKGIYKYHHGVEEWRPHSQKAYHCQAAESALFVSMHDKPCVGTLQCPTGQFLARCRNIVTVKLETHTGTETVPIVTALCTS